MNSIFLQKFRLTAGAYLLRVRIEDRRTGRVASKETKFLILDPAKK